MTYDGTNDLNLTYNHLNLIEKVSRDGNVLAKYSYLADGTKLSALDNDGNGLVYAGSLVYRKQNGVMSLESGAFPEGRFVVTNGSGTSGGSGSSGAGGIETHYHLTDHLGSVRATVQVGLDGDGFVYEQLHKVNNFYPFGMRWQDPNQPVSDNRYRYNAKEEQGFLNLPYTDYGARWRDPKYGIGWNRLDDLSEVTPGISPMAFCGNNPINRIDSDGNKWVDANGRLVWDKGGWTKYAIPAQINAGLSLRASETGIKQFNKLVNSTTPIQVNINSVDNSNNYGTTKKTVAVDENGEVEVVAAEITIYTQETNGYAVENNISQEASLAGTFGHEIEHTTAENTQQSIDFMKAKKENPQYEKIPETLRIYELDPQKIKNDIIKEMLQY